MKRRLARLLAVATLAAGALTVGATPANAVDFPDPLGCDPVAPMSAPGAGVLSLDPGPDPLPQGNPFEDNATVTTFDIYGYAGMEWSNYDLGCGPDALRDADATIAGSIANGSWTALLATASAVTAIQRWTYDPETLDVFEPVQRIAAEALGNRVFMALFGLTLLVLGAYILARSRRGNVVESATQAGWALIVLVGAMSCILWPAKIAPAADSAVTGIVATVNAGVAGKSVGDYSLPDAAASNVQNGILYSTWASGTFGRSSGDTVEKYGPTLYRNSALTRAEARLLTTDPERAQEIIEKKAERYNEAAERLKDEDPIAYEYLAGKHNWSRAVYALAGWFAFACTMLYTFVASLLVLFSLVVVRIAVMLFPLLAVAGAYYPARAVIIRVVDYVVGAVMAAVMFGSAAAVFVAIAGGIMSPTTNTPVLLSALLMLIATAAGWKLTKPVRKIKRFAAPGLERFRREHPDQPRPSMQAPPPAAPPAAETYTRPAQPSFVRTTATSALQGAAMGATFAAATGGASVVAGAATGAARAGAATAAREATGSSLAGAAAGAGAARALPSAVRELPAGPAARTDTAHAPSARVQDMPVAAPATRANVEGARVWSPGEANPSESLRPATATQGVYQIFTPQEAK